MKTVNIIVRVLLGLLLIVTGFNKFLMFMPMPEMVEPAKQFMEALVATGYVMPIVAFVEIVTGIMIIFNRYQALALVILFPIMLNAFLFHLFLDIGGVGGSAMVIIFNTYLLIVNKDKFKDLLKVA